MYIATSEIIKAIDKKAESLGISTRALMGRAGEAVAEVVRSLSPGGRVLILAGKGNNGGDGYAAALALRHSHEVTVYDIFDGGQKSEAGKYYLSECEREGIAISRGDGLSTLICRADVVVDGIFGTGFSGELSAFLGNVAQTVNESAARVVAIDLPLGVNGDTGECAEHTVRADITVALCLPKPAHLSYPAREYMGKLVMSSLGLEALLRETPFGFSYIATDGEQARRLMPKRSATANKGSFGKTLHVTGSDKYRGAAHLALEAALRSGVGITAHLDLTSALYGNKVNIPSGATLTEELRLKFPEAIYESIPENIHPVSHICFISKKYTTTLVGSGSGVSKELYSLIRALLTTEGGPLVLDADAINSVSEFGSPEDLKSAKRRVILTPHPKEFSRLSGISIEYINAHRLRVAENFAGEYNVILLLKGAGTVITDGKLTYINTTGSTALSKGGSGDVLAGLVSSLAAQGIEPLSATALAAYLHGRAGDALSETLSDYGVTPSDLPTELAKQMKQLSQ